MRHGKHYANGAYHNAANNNKENQVSYLVYTACRSPNLMSQSSQGISWNGSGAEAQSPFSVGMEATLLLSLSLLSPLHCMAKGEEIPSNMWPRPCSSSMEVQLDELPEYFLWTRYLKVTAHGVDPVECGADVQAKEVSRVGLYMYQVMRAMSLLCLGFSPSLGHMTALTPAGTLNLLDLQDH